MIEYRYRGVPHPSRPNVWLGQFQAPGLGTRYVRGDDGAPVTFLDAEAADRAALACLMKALNTPTRKPISGQVLEVRRNDCRGRWERLFRAV